MFFVVEMDLKWKSRDCQWQDDPDGWIALMESLPESATSWQASLSANLWN
jgi:hypothetical protein